jgi:aminoglycoside phosphotransferase (APT) family kinase protein
MRYSAGMLHPAGPLVASGRDSEIFEYGPGLVLRRSRNRRSMEKEAKIMGYGAQRGYPAPRVEEISADGSELVMERIDGPTMLEVLSRQPWTLRRHAAVLAALHDRLHEIPGPQALDPFPAGGDCLVHLDLHPLNVILSPKGPVVIDWSNAARGAGPADVALTWLVMMAAEIPGGGVQAVVGRVFRRLFIRSFLGHFDLAPVRAALPVVGMWKCQDRNMRAAEIASMQWLLARESGRP